ncbi:MAG: hypothetical protein WBD79_14740, partial [Anaerolineae bacterium]
MQAVNVQVDARAEHWHAEVGLDPDSTYIIEPSGDRYTLNNRSSDTTDFHGWGEMDGNEIGIPKNLIRLGGLTVLVRHPSGDYQILDFPPGRDRASVRIGAQGGKMYFVIADKAGCYPDNSGICNVTVSKRDRGDPIELLCQKSGEQSWYHKGHARWDNWEVAACNEALDQIRGRVNQSMNLRQLETFTNSNLRDSLGVGLDVSDDSVSFKLATSEDRNNQAYVSWVNANNFLVEVANVRIKPGSAWSRLQQNQF